MTETTTIRIPLATKDRLTAHKDGDQSIGDVVTRLANETPISTENSRARDRVLSYLRSFLVRDFGNQDEATAGEQMWAELHELQHQGNADTNAATGVILDHTALAKLATGSRALARLLYTRPSHKPRRVFAPAMATYTAEIQHTGVKEHIDRLDTVIQSCAFSLDTVLAVGRKVPANSTPAVLHVVHEAQPTMQWPMGRPVITTVPQMYQPFGLRLWALPENS